MKEQTDMKRSRESVLWLLCGLLLSLCLLFIAPRDALAQFGGTQTVFDPAMFARQFQQLQQETQTLAAEAQQLQYMIKNTTGGAAGVWQSDQSMLDELGGLIQQQGGLSYSLGNLQAQFQQQFPGYAVPQNPDQQEAQNIATTLNTLNGTLADAQGQAQQIQMLRQLVVAMINAQNVAAANRVNAQAAEDASVQRWLSAGPTVPFSPTMPDNGLTNFGSPPVGGPQ